MTPVIPEAVAAARAAATAAARQARQAAAVHAASRRHLAGLLAASVLPAAASVVFERDEDTLTAETQITLVSVRDADGTLLWYNDCTPYAAHPDAEALGDPPQLDDGTLSALEGELAAAYDAAGGGFGTADDGASVMPAANLLILPVPSPAPGLTRAAGQPARDEITADDVLDRMREAAAACLDDGLAGEGLRACAYTLAAGFRDLDTGTVLTAGGLPAFTGGTLLALDCFQADEPDDPSGTTPALLHVRCAAVLLHIEPGTTLSLLAQTALAHQCPPR